MGLGLMAGLVRKRLNDLLGDLLNVIVYFPLIIFIIWGLNFGMKRYFGAGLSHIQNGAIGAFGTAAILNFFRKISPARGAFIAAVFGYLLIVLVIWIFG